MFSYQATTTFFGSKPPSGGLLALISCLALFSSLIAAAQPAHGLREASGAVVFEYGWAPAARVADHPPEHAETTMRGGVPRQSGSHIVVALFDRASGARIAGAKVDVSITPLGGAAVSKVLQPMSIEGLPSYGGYVSVERPGLSTVFDSQRKPPASQALHRLSSIIGSRAREAVGERA